MQTQRDKGSARVSFRVMPHSSMLLPGGNRPGRRSPLSTFSRAVLEFPQGRRFVDRHVTVITLDDIWWLFIRSVPHVPSKDRRRDDLPRNDSSDLPGFGVP